MKWKGWTNGILGSWLFITAFLALNAKGNMWNDLIVGVIVAIAAFTMLNEKPWHGWTAGIFGLWLIVASFIPGLLSGPGLLWNNIIVGGVIAFAGFASLSSDSGRATK